MGEATLKRRVVITGMGAISPLGNDVPTLWRNIRSGKSGIRLLASDAFADIGTRIAGTVTDFDPGAYLDAKDCKRYDPVSQYGWAAASQALRQARLDPAKVDRDRIGVYVGSGAGGLETLCNNHKALLEKGPGRVSPFFIPMSICNMISGLIAIHTGFCGPSLAPVSACATGNNAIGEAYRCIAHGYADAMLAGGAEAPITPLYFAGFSKMRAMSERNDAPEQAARPFDRDRDGFVMSEGAGVVFLEALEHARQRGATILAEIVGYGGTTDASHITTPDYHGAARAMQLALQHADARPEDVDYINAHGTATPAGDVSETRAVKEVFGEHAHELKISSTKSMTGHLFGAAGGIEAIITVQSLLDGLYPPTINRDNPDPECDLDYVTAGAVTGDIRLALSNGFGFGGHNAVLAFRKWGPDEHAA